jgi:hypothetical protein
MSVGMFGMFGMFVSSLVELSGVYNPIERMFDGKIQIVLQRPSNSGEFVCRCFGGVPAVNPALITLLPAGGSLAEQFANQAANAVEAILLTGVPGIQIVNAPCGLRSIGPIGCQANSEPNCRHILVLVFDGMPGFTDQYGVVPAWAKKLNDLLFAVVPCLPLSIQSQAKTLIPASLNSSNAVFWLRDPSEAANAVVSAAGISAEDYRLFISYRRGEGQALAEQLFDELNRRNFDVFLDQFRINPGWNFQERLTEELAHKSMIVVLETANIRQSQWVAHEVTYAIRNRLGILAIQPPGGKSRLEIGNRRRLLLTSRSMNTDGTIKQLGWTRYASE